MHYGAQRLVQLAVGQCTLMARAPGKISAMLAAASSGHPSWHSRAARAAAAWASAAAASAAAPSKLKPVMLPLLDRSSLHSCSANSFSSVSPCCRGGMAGGNDEGLGHCGRMSGGGRREGK